jgi:phage/plasmid-associated DNA primase
LKWLIEGAEKIIKNDFKLKLPKAVEDAINIYKRDNDWLAHFFEDCCELGEDLEEKSGGFYDAYRAFCNRTGEYVRNSAEFYAAIEQRGIKRKKTKEGRFVVGIKLINADFVK